VAKRTVARTLRACGYELRRIESTPRAEYLREARPYIERHRTQTIDDVERLNERYREPVFGTVSVWSMVELLGHVIDRVDPQLMNVSQAVHALQVVEAMLADGVDDESLLLAGLIHDLGKVLYLTGEDPANISGSNWPIVSAGPGGGLDHCVLTWNADNFAYSRLGPLVPDHVGWLIRYHSIEVDACVPLMDDRDRDYYERYGKDFIRWDATKSMVRPPRTRLDDYREIVEHALPDPVLF
jgi:hypothetical protein